MFRRVLTQEINSIPRKEEVDVLELRIKEGILEGAKRAVPQKKYSVSHRVPKGWWNEESKEAIRNRKKANKNQRYWKKQINRRTVGAREQ